MLQPLPLMWQRTSSNWRSPMRNGACSAARGSRVDSSSAGSITGKSSSSSWKPAARRITGRERSRLAVSRCGCCRRSMSART